MTYYPIVYHSEPARCPNCERLESIKRVCKRCGYEYPEKKSFWDKWQGIVTFFAICILVSWAIATIMGWLINGEGTLLDCIKGQMKFISKLKLW